MVETSGKAAFLGGLVVAFKEQIHTDVLVKPGDGGPALPAHKAVLAARSKVLRNVLDTDEYKVWEGDKIVLHDLNSEELKSLIEFLYSGELNTAYKHIRSLYLAADKYDIPYLQERCRHHLISELSSRNVLDVLELASIPSDTILKEAALSMIVERMEEVVVPMKYEAFARRNPDLSVEITRAYLRETKALNKHHGASSPFTRGGYIL